MRGRRDRRPSWKTRLAGSAAALMLVACGGGGGDPGQSVFGDGGASSGGSTAEPSQGHITLAAEKVDLDWFTKVDTTKLTFTAADAYGYPAGVGRIVRFRTEAGTVAPQCTLALSADKGSSQCSVELTTAYAGPVGSFVTVMAWMDGEEAYEDANGNGRYDTGERFWDAGRPFLDVNENNLFDPPGDVDILQSSSPLRGEGRQACAPGPATGVDPPNIPLSIENTCDGVWGRGVVRTVIRLPVAPPTP